MHYNENFSAFSTFLDDFDSSNQFASFIKYPSLHRERNTCTWFYLHFNSDFWGELKSLPWISTNMAVIHSVKNFKTYPIIYNINLQECHLSFHIIYWISTNLQFFSYCLDLICIWFYLQFWHRNNCKQSKYCILWLKYKNN